ncbi:glycosyltransferase involved in cell wall biosynthesis [Flavobacteriaceae bacterium MAR_2009_75]|nr:glycosyltransferase involved in cell wall biosynthesis [Flavobacteriaceae bacterium MAR_2009_75]
MRLLWFSNRPPLGALNSKKSVGGSWIESLEQEFKKYPHIDLGIVYNELASEKAEIQSKDSNTKYFMVPRDPYGKFDRWAERFLSQSPSEKTLSGYLEVVDQFQPDVILFFGTESDFPLIIPELKIPSVIWFQGNLTVYDLMYESGISIKKTLSFEKLKHFLTGDTMYHNYLRFKKLVEREKKIFSYAQNFIGRTSWDRRLVGMMSPQAKYWHCDEAMRPPFWENVWQSKLDRNELVITTTIRGNLYKGLETVFRAADILSERIQKQLSWRIMGIAENSVYAKTARKIANFDKSRKEVVLMGNKSSDELIAELLNADMYVHPSHIENSPNGVQEAMLLGMPIVATNVGGTPSLLEDGLEGKLVQNNDPYALAGAIYEFHTNTLEAEHMGKKARERGLVRNSNEKICKDLLEIFHQLTDPNNG